MRARRFVVVDQAGIVRAEMRTEPDGSAVLRLSDAAGAPRAVLGVSGDGLVRRILRALIVRGEPISVREIVAASDDYPEELIYDTLVSLDEEEIISLRGQHMDSAPPLCARPTDFAARVSGGPWRYASGAVDALGVAVMLGGPAEIRSYCHDCNEPLQVSAGPHGPEAGAAAIVLWVGRDFDGRGRRGLHGPGASFFQSEAHLRAWRERNAAVEGAGATLAEAFKLAQRTFGGLVDDVASSPTNVQSDGSTY
jgi:hypothetical protein